MNICRGVRGAGAGIAPARGMSGSIFRDEIGVDRPNWGPIAAATLDLVERQVAYGRVRTGQECRKTASQPLVACA